MKSGLKILASINLYHNLYSRPNVAPLNVDHISKTHAAKPKKTKILVWLWSQKLTFLVPTKGDDIY